MKFTDFKEFKNKLNKFVDIAIKGEHIIITKLGKPIISLSGISNDEIEDFILAKHFKLDKKAKSITTSSKTLTKKEIQKRLGI